MVEPFNCFIFAQTIILKFTIMIDTWIYISYNYDTEMYDVMKQTRGQATDEILKSYKSEIWAHNYKAQIDN